MELTKAEVVCKVRNGINHEFVPTGIEKKDTHGVRTSSVCSRSDTHDHIFVFRASSFDIVLLQ